MLGHVTVTPCREPPHRGRVPTFRTPGGCSTPACVHEAPSGPETSPPGQGRASRAEGPDADKADPLPHPCRALRAEPRRCHRRFESLRSLQGSPPAPRSWPACSRPPTGPASKAGWPEASPSARRGPGPHGRSATPHTGRRRQRHSSVPLPQITARAGASSCKENASILCISLGCKL